MSEPHRHTTREKLMAGALLLVVIIFVLRLIQLQVVQHPLWSAIATNQPELTVQAHGSRGEILDRNGLPMAVTLPLTYAIGYRPKAGENLDRLATDLSAFVPQKWTALRKKLDTDHFTYLAKRVDVSAKQKLELLHPGLFQFDEEPRRTYPGGAHAATILGFTNLEGVGQEGIEASLDSLLASSSYQETYFVDACRQSAALMSRDSSKISSGANISLTIDLQLQTIVENQLIEGLKNQELERACAVLIQPMTGDILALATLPSFDSNNPGDSPAEYRKCWPITDVFEPGSVMKIIPITKALESKKLSRSTVIFCGNGVYKVPGATLHDSHPYGNLTLDEILSHSSNIGAAKVSAHFTRSEIYDKMRAFGFGNLTSIELTGEQSGVVPSPNRWSGPTQANLAMGHGISATALQVALAYGAVASGGYLMKPRLVKSVTYTNGDTKTYAREVVRQVMPQDVARNLTEMLVGVVESGTGKAAQIPGVRVAGKTGTAQKVDQVHKTYFQKRFVSSFIGFLPADKPEYLLLVVVDDPRGNYFGAQVAAPVFKSVMDEIITIRPLDNMKHDRTSPQNLTTTESRPATASYAMAAFNRTNPSVGNSQTTAATDTNLVTVPDLYGWPMRLAVQELSRRNLNFQLFGSRIVTEQNPVAGSVVRAGTTCKLLGTVQ